VKNSYKIWVFIKCDSAWHCIATVPNQVLAAECLRRIKLAGYRAKIEQEEL
jgi:hypothetical protein